MSTDWLKTVVPALATALGGPLAGAAATFIADKLGASEKTVEAVRELMSGQNLTPDQIAALKLAEIDFQKFLEANKIRLEELSVEDRRSARDMQKAVNSWVPGALSFAVTIGFFGILGWLLSAESPSVSEPLLIMLGSLGTAWTGIISYWFGSSHGSTLKTGTLMRK